ncbi:hypothetical protein NQ317_001341 [Molorchus minor]|uniref:Uncharacterized protein n=1 Tax=Molorchus minor TaxID=1323400 RepID=A0ABQ9JNX9_9CUCU|nr:hypothetical protein NQ317_001341 [Molorchus minor]
MVNKYTEKIKLYFLSQNQRNGSGTEKWYYIVPGISLGVILLVIIILILKRCLKKQGRKENDTVFTFPMSGLRKQGRTEDDSVFTLPMSGNQISEEHIYQPVYRNQRNPIYLVPFSALPENFDYSRTDIVVKGDYIIIRDLFILEQPVVRPPSVPSTPTYLEEYKKQEPYNPHFY